MTGGLWDYRDSVWDYRESTWTLDRDLVGYEVEAPDGHLGVVARASSSSPAAYLVVDAGPPIAGPRLVPAGAVTSMHHDGRTVRIALDPGPARGRPGLRGRHPGRLRARRARPLLQEPRPPLTVRGRLARTRSVAGPER